jgi:hypothetical protein
MKHLLTTCPESRCMGSERKTPTCAWPVRCRSVARYCVAGGPLSAAEGTHSDSPTSGRAGTQTNSGCRLLQDGQPDTHQGIADALDTASGVDVQLVQAEVEITAQEGSLADLTAIAEAAGASLTIEEEDF